MPGRPNRFNSTVSVSAAATTACFQLSCTGDSAADSILVPICTPSAPRARAAAIDTPSQIPPAAITGTSTSATTSGVSTMVDEPWGFLNPPPSTPSTMRPSTPASTALRAPRKVGTTWKTVMPASFSMAVNRLGSPAEVVTNPTSCSMTKSMTVASGTSSWAMLTPHGRSVRSRILAISTLMSSSWPEEVSMMPMAPASDTAEASWARAM